MNRLVTALALVLIAALASAEDKITFKTAHREGETFDVRLTMLAKMSGNIQGQVLSMKQDAVKEYREKTVSLDAGRPTKAERTYKAYEMSMEQKFGQMAPQTVSQKNDVVGKPLVLVRKDGKVALEAEPEAGELEADDLDIGTDDFDVLLPDKAVAVGEEWKIPQEKLAAMFASDGPKATVATCKLEEVSDGDGRKVARIAVKMTLKGEQAGAAITADIAGPLLFDLSANRPVSLALKGTMKVATPMGDVEGPMEAGVTMTAVK